MSPPRYTEGLMSRWFMSLTVISVALVISPGRTSAAQKELQVAVFGGIAIPFSSDLTRTDPTRGENGTASNVSLRDSGTYGAKAGGFFGPSAPVRFGAEVSASHFSPDIRAQTVPASGALLGMSVNGSIDLDATHIGATNVAVHLLVRLPTSVVSPYAGVGGGLQRARANFSDGTSDSDWGGLFEALVGVRVPLAPLVSFFAEYTVSLSPHTFAHGTTRSRLTLTTNQFVGGVAIHF